MTRSRSRSLRSRDHDAAHFRRTTTVCLEALCKCGHLKPWWGPRNYEVTHCQLDFRPGGKWRFVHRAADGTDCAFRGEIREIVPNERVVQTFEFEGLPGHIFVETLTPTAKDGKTTWSTRSRFDSQEDRDGMLQSGLESGASETMDRLEEYLPQLAAAAVR